MSILLGLANMFQAVADTIEYGPIEAVKINTSLCPDAERSYREIMKNIDKPSVNNLQITGQEMGGDNLEAFSALIEEVKNCFPVEKGGMNLGLIYDYHQLNEYGKIILDKTSPNQCGREEDLSREEVIGAALLFREKCRKGECDKYSFIFWSLMVYTVDKANKEQSLSRICDFSLFLGLTEEELMNIVKLIQLIFRKKV